MSYTFTFLKQFYCVASGLKIIGHRNPDDNLESPCKMKSPRTISRVYVELVSDVSETIVASIIRS
jgi:hypothetical protein